MRTIAVFLGLIILSACRTDVVVPCSGGSGLYGRVCSEFKIRNNTPVGTVEYSYSNGGESLVTDFVSPSGKVERTIRYTFKDGQVLTERETVDGDEKVKSYSYNDVDSISSIAYFTGISIDSIVYCDFVGGKRMQVRVQDGNDIVRFDDYRYDSGGTLNRISRYSADSVLVSYQQFEFFGNGKLRVKKRSPEHVLIHTDNIEFYEDGRLLQNVRRSSVGDTILTLINSYDQLGKLVEKTEASGNESSSIRYYYYE